MIGIYKITNLINNKVYIGQALNIEERFNQHKKRAFQKNYKYKHTYIYRAIRKYGLDNFSFESIEECKKEDLNDKEQYWISKYQSYPPSLGKGYNMTPGGESGGNRSKLGNHIKELFEDLKNTELSFKELANKYNVKPEAIKCFNIGKCLKQPNFEYPIRNVEVTNRINLKNKSSKIIKYCIDCGCKLKYYKSLRCPKCNSKIIGKRKSIEIPNIRELLQCFNDNNYNKGLVLKYYNISGYLLYKWCKELNIDIQNKKALKELYRKEILGENIISKPKNSRNYKIQQINPKTNDVVNIFNTRVEALKYLGVKKESSMGISRAIKNNILYKNYFWKQIKNE